MRKLLRGVSFAIVALALVGVVPPAFADPESGLGRFIELEDLLAQQSMADAANKMTFIAWIQIAVGLGTLVGLAWTLKYTRDTARAGQKSADAADRALNAVERPYIFVWGVRGIDHDVEMDHLNFVFFIRYSYGNHGKTPAIIESMAACISFDEVPENAMEVRDWHPAKLNPIIVPGECRTDSQECPQVMLSFKDIYTESEPVEIAFPETENFFFRLIIRYRGPFTTGHKTSACWAWDQKENCLVPYGGKEYNYTC